MSDSTPHLTTTAAGPAISIRARVALAELPTFFTRAFHELADAGADRIAGPPFAVYHAFDPVKIDVEAAMPLRSPMEVTVGEVHAISIAGGPAVEVRHVGPYETIGSAYFAIEEWLADHQRARGAAIREVYLSEPTTPSDQRVTLVVQPLQPA